MLDFENMFMISVYTSVIALMNFFIIRVKRCDEDNDYKLFMKYILFFIMIIYFAESMGIGVSTVYIIFITKTVYSFVDYCDGNNDKEPFVVPSKPCSSLMCASG